MNKLQQNNPKSKAKIAYDTLLPAVVLDSEGYPTDEFLKWVEEFNPLEHKLMNFINVLFENWMHGDYGYKLKKKYAGYCALELHTLGWSGNESILGEHGEVRNLGDVKWLATEDLSQGKGTGRHIAMFVLKPCR